MTRTRIGPAMLAGLTLTLCLAVALLALPASAAPKISIPTRHRDLGEMTSGETAELEIPVSNAGTEALTIEQVQVTCGCTSCRFPHSLAPGEAGALKVTLTSSPLWSGPIEKHILVCSNDPEQPTVDLQLTARMHPLFRFSPANPRTIPYKKGQTIQTIFTVTSNVDPPVCIAGVKSGNPRWIEVRLVPLKRTGGTNTWCVAMTIHPPAAGGDCTGTADLETTSPTVPQVALVVHVLAEDVIRVAPRVLHFGRLSATSEGLRPRIVALIKRSGAFAVREVKPDTPALQARLMPPSPGQPGGANIFHKIEIRYLGGWPKGKAAGKILVKTDDPLVPEVEIPYDAIVDAVPVTPESRRSEHGMMRQDVGLPEGRVWGGRISPADLQLPVRSFPDRVVDRIDGVGREGERVLVAIADVDLRFELVFCPATRPDGSALIRLGRDPQIARKPI